MTGRRLASIATLTLVAPALALAEPAGQVTRSAPTATITSPILGGTPATNGEFPTVVAIEVGQGLCTGTVITPNWVLTAAHCVTPAVVGLQTQAQVTQSIKVHLNTVNIDTTAGTVLTAADSIPDPMFNVNNLGQYDSGLIKLATPAMNVTPMQLNFDAAAAPVGVMVTMVGFGATAAGGGGTVGVEMVVQQTSQACTAQEGSNTNLLCFNQTSGQGKCEGDSGGPSFAMVGGKYLQVGITSFGDQTCSTFGADTRVDAEQAFILQHVPELQCQKDADCPMGHECFEHTCIITPFSPGGLGATCTANGDCQSMTCGSGDGGMKCTQSCMVGMTDACPSGFDCLGATGTSGACWPHAGGGCCDAGGANASSIVLGLGVVVLLARRRRRR